jgi:hypothetical protein
LVSQKDASENYLLEVRFGDDLTPVFPSSISHGQTFYNFLSPLLLPVQYRCNGSFDRLPIPVRIVATDIVSGQRVVFSKGELVTAIRASCGVPLAFSPLALDSMLLLDGGLSANIPVETAIEHGAACCIAVDVTSPMWKKEDIDNPVRLLDQVVAIGITRQKTWEREQADVVISPVLTKIRNTDFSSIDTIISRGYRSAVLSMPQIRAALAEISRPQQVLTKTPSVPAEIPVTEWKCSDPLLLPVCKSLFSASAHDSVKLISRDSLTAIVIDACSRAGYPFASVEITIAGNGGTCVSVNPGIVTDVAVEGNIKTSRRLILSAAGIAPGSILRQSSIYPAISSLYATGLFQNVNISVDSGPSVRISLTEQKFLRARLGLRFDEFHLGEGYIQPAYENIFGSGLTALLHLQYGLRREKYALIIRSSQLFSSRIANDLSFQSYVTRESIIKDTTYQVTDLTDTTVTELRRRYSELTLRKAGFLGKIGAQIGRMAMLDGGFRIERFTVTRSDDGVFAQDPLGFKQGIRYLTVRLMLDNLDRFPFPEKGQKHYISVGGASDVIGGTESFVHINGSFGSYFTFRKRHTFIPRLRFSWANKALADVDRVYIGGAISEEQYDNLSVYNYIPFIGLRPRTLSGDIMALVHFEYRFCFGKNLFVSGLVDWGDTWNHDEFSFTESTGRNFLTDAPLGAGISLSYESVAGPIKLSWGRRLSGSIGAGPGNTEQYSAENILYFSAGYDF